jgi:hypothetical protein
MEQIERKLKHLKNSQKVTIFSAEEYELHISRTNKRRFDNLDILWVFGGADQNFYNDYPGKVVLWHNFYLYDSFLKLDNNSYDKLSDIKKVFISMNNRGHAHRCLLLDMLAKHNMIDMGYISWRGADSIVKYNFNHWTPKKLEFNDGFLTKNSIHTLPREYSHALINLVSESTTDTLFLTEKTYHAVLAEKPFLVQGCKGIHAYLSNLGFEMYDEIFDYSFDEVSNDQQRTEMIVENFKKLVNEDLNEINKLLSYKSIRNKQRAIQIIKNREYIPQEAYNFPFYERLINNSVILCNKL